MNALLKAVATVGFFASTSVTALAQLPPSNPAPAPGALALFAAGGLALWAFKKFGKK